METLLLQNKIYEVGSTIGYYSAWILTIGFILALAWVMYKYLDTTELD